MIFDFTGQYNWLPCYLVPASPAFAIFSADGSAQNVTATANAYLNFKTIGSMYEFGSLGDESCVDARKELMRKMLEFFDLGDFITSIDENHYHCNSGMVLSSHPNPFQHETTICFSVGQPQPVDLFIYNVKGQKVATLMNGLTTETGLNYAVWNGCNEQGQKVPQGIYFYRFKSGNSTMTGKMVKLND